MADRRELAFLLFRVQAHFPAQMSMLGGFRAPHEVIRAALMERPSGAIGRASWRIGNVTELSLDGIYFAVGKELPKSLGSIDNRGDFHTESVLVAPNTHVVLDLHYQILAIAKNSDLAPAPRSVARKLQKLLSATNVVADHGCTLTIEPIRDPSGFVEAIASAKAITRFQVTYGLPNVWDVEEDFQRPIQASNNAMRAEESTTTFVGASLNPKNVVRLARAAVAVGKRTKAWVIKPRGRKPVPITPKENPVTLLQSPPDDSQPMRWGENMVIRMREEYEQIRESD